MKKIIISGLMFCFSLSAVCAASNEMQITFKDGSKQAFNLNSSPANISRIDFTDGGVVSDSAPTEQQIKYVKGFEGTWSTNWGEMKITVTGAQVSANYTYRQGKISATLSSDGKTMEGTWGEAPSYALPKNTGRVIFSLSEDGNSINGHWWFGQNTEGGAWTGKRVN